MVSTGGLSDFGHARDEYESSLSFSDYVHAFKRRSLPFLTIVLVVSLIGALVALLLPPVYRSSSTILIEQQEIPTDFVRSTVTSYAAERLQVIGQRVMTTSNLAQIIEKYDLYTEERTRDTMTVIAEEMRGNINVDSISAQVVDAAGKSRNAMIAFTVAFDARTPKLAQQVANEITTLYLNENLKNRAQSAEQTSSFLTGEANRLKNELEALEQRLADFKAENIGRLPNTDGFNRQILERVQVEMREVGSRIENTEERRAYLEAQLAQIDEMAAVYPTMGNRVLSPRERLTVLESEIISLETRYSSTHPDVLRVKREIEALRAEVGAGESVEVLERQLIRLQNELRTAESSYGSEHPEVKRLTRAVVEVERKIEEGSSANSADESKGMPDNPIYIRLAEQLNAIDSELAASRKTLASLREKEDRLLSNMVAAPEVERGYRTLAREYDNTTAKYRDVKNKELEAQLSESLEDEQKGERFTLIEPPVLPSEPIKPNRLAVALLGIFLGLAIGGGLIVLLEAFDPTIHGSGELMSVTGVAPLVVIPFIEIADDKRKRFIRSAVIVTLVAIVAVLAVLAFHFLVMPIDVAWYKMLRNLTL
jgi:polysaccharide biosynthesis transport protein